MRRFHKVLLLIGAAMLSLSFQNCGEFAVQMGMGNLGSTGVLGSAGAVLEPSTDKLDPDCMTNTAFDACVIKQNPVAQLGSSLSSTGATRKTQLASAAIYGVKLTSLTGSGTLENATLSVRSVAPPLSVQSSTNLKTIPAIENSSTFEQVNVYYWMNRASEYLDSRTGGALPAKGKKITVIVDDTITGYDPASNTIRMKMTAATGAVAWNGDLAIHLFGLANIHLANPAGWASLSTSTHQTCNAVDNGCCRAATGCAAAIRFGAAEYFASCLFPKRTKIGDGYNNTTASAQALPGASRDIASISATSAATLFSSSLGDSRSMGLLYTSIWWDLRTQFEASSADIDRIFLEHLTLLTGSDNFPSALAKAKTVDSRLFGGKYSSAIDSALSRHGL